MEESEYDTQEEGKRAPQTEINVKDPCMFLMEADFPLKENREDSRREERDNKEEYEKKSKMRTGWGAKKIDI